ncbi:MAG: DUF4388 domain-containing protein [Actinomycetota bacterium]
MLKGSLEDFALSDICRLLSFTKKTGKLEVVRSAGDGKVFFRDGEVYYAVSSLKREPLGQKLIRSGALTETQLRKALDLNAATGERVGEILLRGGAITEPQLINAVKGQIEDAAFDLLRWETGEFVFEPHDRFSVEIPISVSVENLIMEASRRTDELEVVRRKIPSLEVILAVAPAPPQGAREINITPDEWRMLVLVDGHRPVGEILESTGIDEFTGLRTLYGLISSGLLDVLTLGPVGDTATETPAPPPPPGRTPTTEPTDSYPTPARPISEGIGAEGIPSADHGGVEPETVRGPRTVAPDAGRPEVAEEPEGYPSGPEMGVGRRFAADLDHGEAPEPAPLTPNGRVPEGWFDSSDAGEPVEEGGPTETLLTDLVEGADEDPVGSIAPALGREVDRDTVVRELAGLFGESEDARKDDDDAGHSQPPGGRKRVEDDEQIDQQLIGRLIDGVKGL